MTDLNAAFAPDYAIPPGTTIREVLEKLDISQTELASRTNLSTKHVNQILQGVAPLTYETAIALERVTGVSARFWNSLEADYRLARARLEEEVTAEDRRWLRALPIGAIQELGHLPEVEGDERTLKQAVLRFFGVSSREAFDRTWLRPAVAWKRSPAFKPDQLALAAWLRIGELDAGGIDAESFDAATFRRTLRDARRLTRADSFGEELRDVCATAGVAVVYVPELPACRVSGATRWISPTKALIQLSDRYKHDDNLWFAFFHEAGHVLLHSKRDTFIDDGVSEDGAETEANEFAQDLLIPRREAMKLPTLQSMADVIDFAERIGIAPGIVVGRLHREKLWGWNKGNQLRRKVTIS